MQSNLFYKSRKNVEFVWSKGDNLYHIYYNHENKEKELFAIHSDIFKPNGYLVIASLPTCNWFKTMNDEDGKLYENFYKVIESLLIEI